MHTVDDKRLTSISWRFGDWRYYIGYCTPHSYSLKFPVTPPTNVKKTWEISFTPKDLTIKCNTLQVLYFIFDNTCTKHVKGRKATEVMFHVTDTATKMFTPELTGKWSDMFIHYIIAYIM